MHGERPDHLQKDLPRIGERLRRLRRERGRTLEDLATRTGLSRAYGVSFSSLFAPEQEARHRTIVRARDAEVRRGKGLSYRRLSASDWTFNLQPLRVVVPAEREGDTLYQHEGGQQPYVLSGRLCPKLGDEELVLQPGDAAHFDAEQKHRFEALDGRDAEAILVA